MLFCGKGRKNIDFKCNFAQRSFNKKNLTMLYIYLKALHIIGFVAWFAGLFYLVRLFVYHVEAYDRPEVERAILCRQYSYMEQRLFQIITQPAMVFTVICGVSMLWTNPSILEMPWMQVKIVFLIALITYHYYCKNIIKKLTRGERPFSSFQFRLFNELPTLFLFGIVLLAVLKNTLNMLYGFLILILIGTALFVGARFYKKWRTQRGEIIK